jgi:Spy/CpxP family protein refolding chaperone
MKHLYALFLFSLLLVPPLFAQDSYFDFERGLKLSDDQRLKVEDVKKKYMREWRISGRDVMQKRMALRELYKSPSQNKDRIEKLQNEVLEIEVQRENLYNQYRGEISKILNDEQRERYDNFSNSERRRPMVPMGLRGYGR